MLIMIRFLRADLSEPVREIRSMRCAAASVRSLCYSIKNQDHPVAGFWRIWVMSLVDRAPKGSCTGHEYVAESQQPTVVALSPGSACRSIRNL